MHPRIDPYDSGFLARPDGAEIYWETSGNPQGRPALYLHGGPGGGLGGSVPRAVGRAVVQSVVVVRPRPESERDRGGCDEGPAPGGRDARAPSPAASWSHVCRIDPACSIAVCMYSDAINASTSARMWLSCARDASSSACRRCCLRRPAINVSLSRARINH